MLVAVAALAALASVEPQPSKSPHILFMLADDLGYANDDLGIIRMCSPLGSTGSLQTDCSSNVTTSVSTVLWFKISSFFIRPNPL